MVSPIKKVAIAGATGALGSVVTDELLKAGFEVTALTRDASKAKLPSGVNAVSVDYDSLDSLKAALQGQHAIVSTIAPAADGQQKPLIDAAIAAGVQKIIPSDFGSDHSSPEASKLPAYQGRIETEKYLVEKTKGTPTTWTSITNNGFLDWGIEYGFLINVKERKANIIDGGDAPWTATPLYLIAQAVIGVLKKPEETANRILRIHGTSLTSKSLLKLVQESTGSEGWELTQWDTVERVKQAYALMEKDPGNVHAWAIPMIFRAGLSKDLPTDYSHNNNNALVGIETLTDEEVRKIVKASVAKVM